MANLDPGYISSNPIEEIKVHAIIPTFEVGSIGPEETIQIAIMQIKSRLAEAVMRAVRYEAEYHADNNYYEIRGIVQAYIPRDNGISKLIEAFGRANE